MAFYVDSLFFNWIASLILGLPVSIFALILILIKCPNDKRKLLNFY